MNYGTGAYQNILLGRNQWKDLFRGPFDDVQHRTPLEGQPHTVLCIPEGKYDVVKRWSPKFARHLLLMNVPQRNSILIHPANDAMHELKGCIAPVCCITGAGTVLSSVSQITVAGEQ